MKVNIFELAELQLIKEGKINSIHAGTLLIKRAMTIRQYLDIVTRNKKILQRRYRK